MCTHLPRSSSVDRRSRRSRIAGRAMEAAIAGARRRRRRARRAAAGVGLHRGQHRATSPSGMLHIRDDDAGRARRRVAAVRDHGVDRRPLDDGEPLDGRRPADHRARSPSPTGSPATASPGNGFQYAADPAAGSRRPARANGTVEAPFAVQHPRRRDGRHRAGRTVVLVRPRAARQRGRRSTPATSATSATRTTPSSAPRSGRA